MIQFCSGLQSLVNNFGNSWYTNGSYRTQRVYLNSAPRAPPATDEAVVSPCLLTAPASLLPRTHDTHVYYLDLTDTSCISTWKPPQHFTGSTRAAASPPSAALRSPQLPRYHCTECTGLYPSEKMATVRTNRPNLLAHPPFNTVIFINFHGLIIDQTLLLTFEHK